MRAVIPVMRCERYGRIINLASRSAEGAAPGEPEAVCPTLREGIGHAAARRTKREDVPLRAGVLAAPSEARGYSDAPDTKSARDDAIRLTESTPMSTMRRSSPSKRRRAVRAAVPLSEIQPYVNFERQYRLFPRTLRVGCFPHLPDEAQGVASL